MRRFAARWLEPPTVLSDPKSAAIGYQDATASWEMGAQIKVSFGSYLTVPLTSGGGLLSGVKLKKEDQKLTLGSKVGLPLESSLLRGDRKRPPVAHKLTFPCQPRSGRFAPGTL